MIDKQKLPISLEKFTELAHRTASRYSHRSEREKIAYTFLPHTLEDFHRQVCEVIEADRVSRDVPAGWCDFVERLSKQKPEKPDYWSTCGQCERNISEAEDLIEAFAASPQPQPVAQPVRAQLDPYLEGILSTRKPANQQKE